jgi:predicted CXXCH cytochrome family protein
MHVFRPLFIILGVAALFLIVRALVTPGDFGIGRTGYTYGWHRKGAEEDAKSVRVKYRGAQYCSARHAKTYDTWSTSVHGVVKCENCHGPAGDHPADPKRLPIDRTRTLCLRCHAALPYAQSGRAIIRGIEADKHYAGVACSTCHQPHHPVRMETK